MKRSTTPGCESLGVPIGRGLVRMLPGAFAPVAPGAPLAARYRAVARWGTFAGRLDHAVALAPKSSWRTTLSPTLATNGTLGMLTPQSAYWIVLVAVPVRVPSAAGVTVTSKVLERVTSLIVRSPVA